VTELVTECQRCRVGGRVLTADTRELERGISRLSTIEKQILADWVKQDKREFSTVEQLWGRYRSLPAQSRAEVQAALGTETLS